MNEEYFRVLFQKLIESGQLSKKTAEELLQKILNILYNHDRTSKK